MHLKNIFLPLALVVVLGGLVGCSSFGKLLNPYEDEFKCRAKDETGNCVDTRTAYNQSKINDNSAYPLSELAINGGNSKEKDNDPTLPLSGKKAYTEAYYNELKTMVGAPETPVLAPPKVLRVFFVGYHDSELYMPRFVFLKVKEADWVLDAASPSSSTSK